MLRNERVEVCEWVDEMELRREEAADDLRRLVDEHLSGRRDHSHLLWRLLVLEVWLGALADGRLERASPLANAVRGAAAAGVVNVVRR